VEAWDLRLDGVRRAAREAAAAAESASRVTSEAARRRGAVAAALESAGGNRTHAARLMGVDRRTVQRAIARFGLDGPPEGPSRKKR
jgi:transcriptional regulator with GAF, ATPase, and Fis domain